MPLNQHHCSVPRAFRQPRLLIVGCGDVGLRVAKLLRDRFRLRALTSSESRRELLRHAGVQALRGNLDQPQSIRRLASLSTRVLHLAPPPLHGLTDPRTRHLMQALSRSTTCQQVVYGSTTGVYGDCKGAKINETRAPAPQTARAHRRVDAEAQVRQYGRRGRSVCLLRIPGIYALNREGGPRERLLRCAPVLLADEDVYTNHIHADDLARACVRALFQGRPQRAVHVCDDSDMKMGDYFDWAAALLGLPAPPRMSRAQATAALSDMAMSFLSESRRLCNDRLKRELRLVLRYPTLAHALA